MIISPQLRDIKRAQKEANLLKEISKLVLELTLDESSLQGISVSRIKLTPDKSKCYVFFSCAGGEEEFRTKLKLLILYKPSMRSALAKALNARYTPDLMFKFDAQSEMQKKMEDLFQKLEDDKPSE